MRNIKVLVMVSVDSVSAVQAPICRCERVARFGSVQHQMIAYEPFFDEDVTLLIRVVDWHNGNMLPLDILPIETLRIALNKINLQI